MKMLRFCVFSTILHGQICILMRRIGSVVSILGTGIPSVPPPYPLCKPISVIAALLIGLETRLRCLLCLIFRDKSTSDVKMGKPRIEDALFGHFVLF